MFLCNLTLSLSWEYVQARRSRLGFPQLLEGCTRVGYPRVGYPLCDSIFSTLMFLLVDSMKNPGYQYLMAAQIQVHVEVEGCHH